LGLILSFSLILGVVCIIEFRHGPFNQLPILDELAYVEWGNRIAAGDILGSTVFYQDPLYPYFLGLVFRIAGPNYVLVRLLQALMGTMSVAVVFWTARKLLGGKPALLAAAIMAAYHGLYFFELQLLKESMFILFSALSYALGVASADQPRSKGRWLGLGLVLGLLTLLRGNYQAILPLAVIWAFVYDWKEAWPERLLRAAAVGLGLALVIVPVTARNHAVGGEWVLTTSQGGANFYIGNNPLANGRYVTLPFVQADPRYEAADFKAEAEKRTGRKLKPSQVSRFWYREAFAWIEANPGRAFELLLHKARLMIHQYEIPDNHSFYFFREELVPALWLAVLGFGVLWGPGLIGLGVLARQDRRAWYPALFALLYAFSIIPFFILDRYRLAVMPAMAVFAAGFARWVIQQWKQARWRRLALALFAFVLSLALGFVLTPESQTPPGPELYVLANAYLKTGQPAQALPLYDRAIPILPKPEDAIRSRGEAMRELNGSNISALIQGAEKPSASAGELVEIGYQAEKLGQVPTAARIYERAAAKDANNFSAHARLGVLFCTDLEMQDFKKALRYMKQALGIKPHDFDTMNALGNCYFLAGDTIAAAAQWEAILKIQPAHYGASRNLKLLKSQAKK
jgi:4-amino-4-deoxy-L-arabinose transferase-like glycosyltransferase